jgi:Cu-Zn family superoxide dismutase
VVRREIGTVLAAAALGILGTGVFGAASAQGVAGSAALMDASGQVVGTATLTQVAGGVRIAAQLRNLPPGAHGFHIHAVGSCQPPDFTSAGGHFNPTNRQHGLRNPAGPHAGDLPNLAVAPNGTANYATTNAMVTLGPGPNSLFDADGSALVIHADPDDEVTDPTGNSGGRIACGTIVAGAAALPATGSGPAGLRALPATAAALAGAGAAVLGVRQLARRRR